MDTTPNDIVTELRQRHANVTGRDPRITNPFVGPTIFSQAADEIDRLRGLLADRDEANANNDLFRAGKI